ncbi:MAG: histidinol-phosphatase [Rhodobacteraceae bacterium]|nr:histidinol-phosphatase [Paracoccaceae bacterium]
MADFSLALQSELMATAKLLADAARPIALRYFRGAGLGVDNKLSEGFDPVTVADREIEIAMREILSAKRPQDAILGEEFGEKTGTSGLTWVLDPIDGTRGFISGTPTWGVLIAVGPDSGPVLGIIDQPYTGERFTGAFGQASLTRGSQNQPIRVRACESLSLATLFTTFPEIGTIAERSAFEKVQDQVQLTRYGTDCYAYALLASGQIDLVIEAGLNAYDIQGPLALIQQAGGIVTNWQGGPAHDGGQVIAAGDARIHKAALALLG